MIPAAIHCGHGWKTWLHAGVCSNTRPLTGPSPQAISAAETPTVGSTCWTASRMRMAMSVVCCRRQSENCWSEGAGMSVRPVSAWKRPSATGL